MKFNCQNCHQEFTLSQNLTSIKFCPFCSSENLSKATLVSDLTSNVQDLRHITDADIALIPGHAPSDNQVQFSIGTYKIIESIGKGGMGEVFLAYDTSCGRRIALKKIREDLLEHRQIQSRFLKEAHITSQLTHPAIIPIYSIHEENNLVYYTMPFVEGDTLKQILRKVREQSKDGIKSDQIGSIPFLMRIFLSICQAVAYAHSKGILHRDLKLENIIIGKYGEVLILDWGLAQVMKLPSSIMEEELLESNYQVKANPLHHITRLGKVVGTVAYMAPERAIGQPANIQTDIYSLGVILYQMLTLRHPFKRGTLKEFRKKMKDEKFYDPVEIAPYRDIPIILSRIATKSLSINLDLRYQTVDELIHDLETYLEGRSEWIQIAELSVSEKQDWEFQENVLIAEHTAVIRETEVSDWVNMMVSKASFTENTRIEARVTLGLKCQGIGFLLSIPESDERLHLNDGYCLWLSSDSQRSTKLLRSTVEVMNQPDIFLHREKEYLIRIERIDQNIYLYLDNVLQFSYIGHIPLTGTHIGLLTRDADYKISTIKVSVGNLNIKVNCLAVPDAFLAHKDFNTALSEYRRIGYSFPGTAEGREAMFRAGVTLLEQARNTPDSEEKQNLYELSLEEFWKLHSTPGAPLEYLGKALVYQSLEDYDEEIKCFELAYRRYPKHPLLPILEEQVLYRMLESSRQNRKATYQFILFAIRYLPNVCLQSNAKKLFSNLQRHWEPLAFLLKEENPENIEKYKNINFAIHLSFWSAKPYVLAELIDQMYKFEEFSIIQITNALSALIEIGSYALANYKIQEISKNFSRDKDVELFKELDLLSQQIKIHSRPVDKVFDELLKMVNGPVVSKSQLRSILYVLNFALKKQNYAYCIEAVNALKNIEVDSDGAIYLNCILIYAYMGEKKWSQVGEILLKYPIEVLNHELHPFHFFYGLWLYMTEGKEIASIHFDGILDTSFPRTWALFGHHYNEHIDDNKYWLDRAFVYEKRQLYAQAAFFYQCVGNVDESIHYWNLEAQMYVYAKV